MSNHEPISEAACIFCHNSGMAKCVDLTKLKNLSNGNYTLSELEDKFGEYTACPEGCQILN